MQFTPYLNFDGNCAEAFAFYAKLFGGTIVHQGTFGEMPASEGMPPIPESASGACPILARCHAFGFTESTIKGTERTKACIERDGDDRHIFLGGVS